MATTALATRPVQTIIVPARRRRSTALARRRPRRRAAWYQKVHIPIAIVAGFMPVTKDAIDLYMGGGFRNVARYLPKRFVPYDAMTNKWTFDKFMVGTGSILLGVLAHKLIGGKLGLNKALAQAGVPFIRF